jgi:hypothetical protein
MPKERRKEKGCGGDSGDSGSTDMTLSASRAAVGVGTIFYIFGNQY